MSNEPTANTLTSTSATTDDLPAPAIAPEGWPIIVGFVIGSALLTALAAWLGGPRFGPLLGGLAGFVTIALTIWCVWFFRDPRRRIPVSGPDSELVISPADGVICFVGPALPPEEAGLTSDERLGLTRVSVFMNVFNVHVNRAPIAGVVDKVAYRPGKFFNASFDKASEHNERSSIVLRRADGSRMVCTQIAGLIARRIVCRVKEGKQLVPGERYGIIRFGSRVDVYLPRGVQPRVKVGDPSVAGETVFASLPAAAAPRVHTGSAAGRAAAGITGGAA